MATRMFNAMMRQVTDSADPEALRVARRFPLAMRWPIYSTGVRSQRVLQLAEAFPLLAYRIHFLLTSQENEKGELTIRMIERGAKLRDIAAVWGFPMRLRRIKPAAVFLVSGVLLLRPELLDHMPEALPKMRRWLRAVGAADARLPDYALWVARNWASIDGFQEIENFADWVRANRQIERQFVPSMSVRTVRQLSAEWHEAIARAAETESGPFPQPWFPAGRLSSGEEIVPITNSVDLLREGQAMHHCVASYSRCVIAGQQYIYSIRKSDQRIATLALTRDELGKATLGQIRGACNAAVPAKIMTTVRRWLASQQSGVPEASPQQ